MHISKKLILLMVILSTVTMYQNCAPGIHQTLNGGAELNSLGLPGGSTYSSGSAQEVAALSILNSACVGCHGATSGSGNIFGLHDVDHMVAAGYILPGNGNGSLFVDSIVSGRMPPGGGMSSTDINSLISWIDSLTLQQQQSSGGGVITPPPPVLEAKFSSISKLILQPKCVACHGASVARSAIRYDTYDLTLKTVKVGMATESALFKECQSGSMPPIQNGYQLLNSDELRALSDWINQGALNN